MSPSTLIQAGVGLSPDFGNHGAGVCRDAHWIPAEEMVADHKRLLLNFHAVDEVVRVSKAGGRKVTILFVMQDDTFTHRA